MRTQNIPDITNLSECRKLALAFLNLEPEPINDLPFFVQHPFFDCKKVPYNDADGNIKFADIFDDPDKFEQSKKPIADQILNGDLCTIFCRMLAKYHLSYLKYAKPYMSKKDFETWLAYAWVESENPNQDINVSIPTFIQWFKSANRKHIMNEVELQYYNQLPKTVTIYRGVAVNRAEQQGLSWTCNLDTAKWFAHRFDTENELGYVLKGEIAKPDIFAYFNRRGEDEILCNSQKVKNIERMLNYENLC